MTTTTETIKESSAASDAADRNARLSSQVGGLRTRAAAGSLDRLLLVAGAVLMPLGVVFIILGWAGASKTPLPFEQNDYLISGGILGLALVVAGGFTYFAYWQTVRVRESRVQARELTGALRRLEALLSAGAAGGRAVATTYVATASGTIFHRADCATVAGREDLSTVDPSTTKLSPCKICTPLDEA